MYCSILAAGLIAVLEGIDTSHICQYMTAQTLGKDLKLTLRIDSASCYNFSVLLTCAQGCKLPPNLHALRQAYENREIKDILWIFCETNPEDKLTKEGGERCSYVGLKAH